jgi:hypothetical protein
MYFFLIYLFLSTIEAIVITKIYRSAIYHPVSTCAFLGNASWVTDASIQSCIWTCANEAKCQTAVFYNDDKLCSMFSEFCELGTMQPSGNVSASIICYRQTQSKTIFYYDIEETPFVELIYIFRRKISE